jgi:hypothetical protein
LFDPQASAGGMLAVSSRPGLLLAGKWFQRGAGIVVVLVACVILADRFRRAIRRQRRVLGPQTDQYIAELVAEVGERPSGSWLGLRRSLGASGATMQNRRADAGQCSSWTAEA